MGERAAYRVKSKYEISPSLRKQWGPCRTESLIEIIINCVKILLNCDEDVLDEVKIGDGFTALRDDLEDSPGRLFLALCYTLAEPPFDEITNEPADISDHGLFEIEIKKWNHWIVWHYNVKWKDDSIIKGSKRKVLEVKFEKGKTIKDGMKFLYISNREAW